MGGGSNWRLLSPSSRSSPAVADRTWKRVSKAVRDAMAQSLAGSDEEISSDDVDSCRGLSEAEFKKILGRVIFGGDEEST